jgi:Uma2 family endonuclease
MASPAAALATVDDLLAIPESDRFHEVIDGELLPKALPSLRHGVAQLGLGDVITGPYGPRARGRGPGGWIFASETEVLFEPTQVYRPDVAGWRREHLPTLADETPVTVRPDWVCEILSPSNASNDLIRKLRTYQRAGVGHYWVLDPEARTLTVYRWGVEGYLLVQTAAGAERIHAEPFAEVEFSLDDLLDGDAP